MFGSTGRRRSVSWIVASTYGLSSSARLLGEPGEHAGSRLSRSNAQASVEAVVSWPATSSVISSSRSSWSDIGEPSSWRAAEEHREDVVAVLAALGAALVDLLEDQARRSVADVEEALQRPDRVEELIGSRARRVRSAPGSASSGCRRRRAASTALSRSASRRGPGSRPNTARRMISSVSAWRRGCSSISSRPHDRDLVLGHPADEVGRAAPSARRGTRAGSACAAPCGRRRRAGSPSCGRRAAPARARPRPGAARRAEP